MLNIWKSVREKKINWYTKKQYSEKYNTPIKCKGLERDSKSTLYSETNEKIIQIWLKKMI